MTITLFYIPVSGENEARALAKAAIDARLAACANIFPIQSLYMWDHALQDEAECVLLLKTLPDLEGVLTTLIQSLHTYQVPCILHWQVEVNAAYGQWVKEAVTGG